MLFHTVMVRSAGSITIWLQRAVQWRYLHHYTGRKVFETFDGVADFFRFLDYLPAQRVLRDFQGLGEAIHFGLSVEEL